jgi:tetratricopeptide (TPR) repeat protein
MRRLVVLLIALSTLACHRGQPTQPPAGPAAELESLIARIDGVADDPWPGACDELDAALAQLADSEVGKKATYARAEAALRCDRADRWQALHERLARDNYRPSLVRLANDAVDHQDWDRALVIVERLLELSDWSDDSGEHARLQQVEARLLHARWVDRGDPADFARLERAAKVAIAREFKRLEPRAALIRLYAEHAAITGAREWLILAQLTEREARRIADELGIQSPVLELVAGFVRELEGDRIAAIAAWTRALELNVALVEPHLWLGLAALEGREFAVARAHLQAFVDVHPNHVDALVALGVAARGVGDQAGAEQAYQRASVLDEDDPRVLWNRALAHDPCCFAEEKHWNEYDALYVEFASSLRAFVAAYRRVGPRSCPARGAAGPDVACVREAEALERAHDRAVERIADIEGYLRGYDDRWLLSEEAARLEALEQAAEEERREQLRELERAAEAAGQ